MLHVRFIAKVTRVRLLPAPVNDSALRVIDLGAGSLGLLSISVHHTTRSSACAHFLTSSLAMQKSGPSSSLHLSYRVLCLCRQCIHCIIYSVESFSFLVTAITKSSWCHIGLVLDTNAVVNCIESLFCWNKCKYSLDAVCLH